MSLLRGIVEGVGDYGLAVISPVGLRSRKASWLEDVKMPYGINTSEMIGYECLYSHFGGRAHVIGIYMDDGSIPNEYIERYGRENIIWAGDYHGIITKANGTIAIVRMRQKDNKLIDSPILQYDPEEEKMTIVVNNFYLSSIGASNGGNFTIEQDAKGNVAYQFKGKTNIILNFS